MKKDLTEEEQEFKKLHEKKSSEIWDVRKGRLNGKDYIILSIVLGFAGNALSSFGLILLILSFAFFSYVELSLIAKRFRDIGLSGWFAVPFALVLLALGILVMGASQVEEYTLFSLIFGLLGFVAKLILAIWPAEKGGNKYGPEETVSLIFGKIKKKEKKTS